MSPIVLGGIFGFIYGFLLQKGDLCFVSAFRDWFGFGTTRVLRGIAAILIVAILGWGLVLTAGWAPLSRLWIPSFGYNSLLGGILFGIGMTIAGGCASGTLYRCGMGYVHFWITLAAMGLAYLVFGYTFDPWVADYWFKPLRLWKPFTFYTTFGIPYILTSVIVVLLLAGLMTRNLGLTGWVDVLRESLGDLVRPWQLLRKKSWDTRLVGILIGLTVTVHFALLSAWSITTSEARISVLLVKPLVGEDAIGSNTYFSEIFLGYPQLQLGAGEVLIIFMIIGAFVASVLGGVFRVRPPKLTRVPNAVFGGFLMGFASRLAPGCNVANVISGLAGLSVHSILVSVGIAVGALVVSYYLYGGRLVRPWRIGMGA